MVIKHWKVMRTVCSPLDTHCSPTLGSTSPATQPPPPPHQKLETLPFLLEAQLPFCNHSSIPGFPSCFSSEPWASWAVFMILVAPPEQQQFYPCSYQQQGTQTFPLNGLWLCPQFQRPPVSWVSAWCPQSPFPGSLPLDQHSSIHHLLAVVQAMCNRQVHKAPIHASVSTLLWQKPFTLTNNYPWITTKN